MMTGAAIVAVVVVSTTTAYFGWLAWREKIRWPEAAGAIICAVSVSLGLSGAI